jgi:hypothetical protein
MPAIGFGGRLAAFLILALPSSLVPGMAAAEEDRLSRALLYEEPLGQAGNSEVQVAAVSGSVEWRLLDAGEGRPTIEGSLEIPSRQLKMRLTIGRNSDTSLPATHLIEIRFDGPKSTSGRGIGEVRGVAMKRAEPERGVPLSALATKIGDGLFRIALSATDVSTNVTLLGEGEWIDMPFVYDTGQRAILAFEKGPTGDRVFREALAAWESRDRGSGAQGARGGEELDPTITPKQAR